MIRRLLVVLAVAVLVAPLGACGKKGDLEPPPDRERTDYPRTYPSQ